MKPNSIRAELMRRGAKISSIAEELHVSQPHVSNVIAGRVQSERVQDGIARIIGKSRERVFGSTRRDAQRQAA